MKTMILLALILMAVSVQAGTTAKEKTKRKVASSHQCAADALKRAPKLFKLQTPGGQTIVDKDSLTVTTEERTVFGMSLSYDVIQIQVLDGNSPYLTKFLYQQNVSTCNLMGQEILDGKNPY